MPDTQADYIIIGAGSAGCAIANRLSADPKNQVTLLEAGGRDLNPWIHIPVGYFKTMNNPNVDWCYKTEPDQGINNRSINWPRGKVLGGSSSLNGLLYVRGQPYDYDRWRQMGNTGWSWSDVLPFFKKAECRVEGGDEFHGADGPLKVSNMRLQRPICDAWVAAAQRAGYPFNPDYNGETQEGVGYFQLTAHNGLRCSSAVAYLKPIKKRNNLNIMTRSHATQIIFDGTKAIGVKYTHKDGTEKILKANREIILSLGAIGSPQLLMLSGVGEAAQLQQNGIGVLADLPGVGKNLQDHLQARLVFKCNEPTLNDEVNNLFRQAMIGLKYILFRCGPMTMAASLATGFLKTRDSLETPDIQFHIQPWSADSPSEGVHPFSAFTMSVCQLRPESRGEIRLESKNPRAYPKIHPNYLATPGDQQTIVDGVKIAREIAKHKPLSDKISSEHAPGAKAQSDEDILEWVRNSATTIYHPTGTCKMGQDNMSVVDERLKVHGLQNLRVADCSIMPEIVSGNTNAPAIMIGEKASAMILEDNHG